MSKDEQKVIEQILDDKIIEWKLDRSEQKQEHDLNMEELLERIENIKTNGNGKDKKDEIVGVRG